MKSKNIPNFGKIKSINIKEFRGIKECKKPLQFDNLTVLIGRNNSGKTSILEALYLFPNPTSYNTPFKNNNRLNILSGQHQGIESLIYGYSGNSSIDYHMVGIKIPQGYQIDISEFKMNINLDEKGGYAFKFDIQPDIANRELTRFYDSKNLRIDNFSFFIPNNTLFLNMLGDIDKNISNKMVKEKSHVKAVELVNNYVHDSYTEILFSEGIRARKELADNILYINIKDLGDGIQKAIKIILWVETIKPSVLLWDDFETTAHPSLIKALLEYLLKKKVQIILSTHSIDVLYALTEIKPKNTTILQLSKSKDDVLDYKKLSVDQMEDLIDASNDPRLIGTELRL